MRIQTTRFGSLDVEASSILRLHPGLLGFETRHRYVLLQTEENPSSSGCSAWMTRHSRLSSLIRCDGSPTMKSF